MYQRRLVGLLLSGAAVILILTSVFTRTWWGSAADSREVSIGLRSAEVCEKVRRTDDRSSDRVDPDRDAPYPARPADPSDYDYDDEDRRPPRRERTRTDCVDQGMRGYLEDEQDRADDLARYDEDAPEASAIPGAFIRLGAVAFAFGILAALAVAFAAGVILLPRAPRHRMLGTVVALVCAAFAGVSLAFIVASPAGFGGGVRAGPGVVLALLGAAAGVAGALILQRLDAATEPAPRVLGEATRISTIGRAPVLIAGALGVVLIGAALFTHTWFHGEHGDASIGIGLRAVENCDRELSFDRDRDRGREECVTATVPARYEGAEQPTKMKVFVTAGNVAWLFGLGAIAVALACGGLVALRQPIGGRLAAWRIQIGAAAAFAVAAIVYTASRPAEVSDVGISFGPVLAVGGAGCLVGGAIMLGRWVASMQLAIKQVPETIAHESSAPMMMPQFHHGLGAAMPPPSPFVMHAPQLSPFAPPGAIPGSPFAPPMAPSPFGAPTVVSPFAPPYAQPAPPPPQYAPAPVVMPIAAAPVSAPVAAPFAMAFGAPTPMAAIPSCPQCHTPMLWVTAKGSWMCTVCRGRS